MRSYSIRTWITQGTYPRLFLFIISVMLLVIMVRYHLMLGTELAEARQHQRAQLQATSHYFLSPLARFNTASGSDIQASLEHELAFNPELLSLQWSQQGTRWTARAVTTAETRAPAWFTSWADLAPMRGEFPIPQIGAADATLAVEVSGGASENGKNRTLRPGERA